jgi:hypothetical protein
MDDLQKSLLEASARRRRAGILTIAETQIARDEAAKARRAAAKQRQEELRAKMNAESQARANALRETVERQALEATENRKRLIALLEEAASKRTLRGLGKPTSEAETAQRELQRLRNIEAGEEITRIERSIIGGVQRG